VHPKHWHQSKIKVGGTKKINLDKIVALNPDLIIANKEENLKADVEALKKIAPVWISDINDLSTAIDMIVAVGEITNTRERADNLANAISTEFSLLKISQNIRTCIYLIWRNPYMTIGSGTFINDMFKYCNLENVFANKKNKISRSYD